jgi:hypothetical protein
MIANAVKLLAILRARHVRFAILPDKMTQRPDQSPWAPRLQLAPSTHTPRPHDGRSEHKEWHVPQVQAVGDHAEPPQEPQGQHPAQQ